MVPVEAGELGHSPAAVTRRPASLATEDRGNHDRRAIVLLRVRQHGLTRQGRSGDVIAQDVLELDGLCRRRDVVGRDVGEDRVLVEDVVELPLEAIQLLVREPETREVRDMLDIGTRQGGHAPDDSRVPPRPRLRPMTPADLDPAVDAILADHFGDRRTWFEFALRSAACHPVVADLDGEVVGTGVATVNGPIAWVGTIWVTRSHRRHGLGRALTDAVIDASTTAGAETLVLVATDRGRPLYEGMGFEVQTWYRTLEAPGTRGGDDPTSVDAFPPFTPGDLEAMIVLDRAATGEDRATVLRELASPGGTRVLHGDDGAVLGFVARAPWGGGATVAPIVDDALTILDARRRAYAPDKRVRCGILLENEVGAAALERAGWQEAWRAPRMIRGAPMAWHPEHLWGQFNHAMG